MKFSIGTTVYIKQTNNVSQVSKSFDIFGSTQHMYCLNGHNEILYPESELELYEIKTLADIDNGLQIVVNKGLLVTNENYLRVVTNLERVITEIKENMKTPPKYDDSSDEEPPKKVVKPKCDSSDDEKPKKKKVVKPKYDSDSDSLPKKKQPIANCKNIIPSQTYREEIFKLLNTRSGDRPYINVATLQHTNEQGGTTKGIFTGPVSYRKQIEWFHENEYEM